MQQNYRPILPVPPIPEAQGLTDVSPPEPVKRKRYTMACNNCRAKKTGCDGARPVCTPCATRATICTYISSKPESPATVKKREMKTLKDDHRTFTDLIDILRAVPEAEAIEILRELRQTTANSVYLMPPGTINNCDTLPRLLTHAPTQGSVEFELMIRHAVAYPTLVSLDTESAWVTPQYTALPVNSVVRGDSLETSAPSPTDHHQQDSVRTQHQSEEFSTAESKAYCDSRLEVVNISFWTRINITSELAAKLISLYLETDHPTLGLFDADLFLVDLIDCNARYCSKLLVSAVLLWACHAYNTFEPQTLLLREAFFREVDELWQLEKNSDSLSTVAAAQLLSITSIYNGRGSCSPYSDLGVQMAQRMGLFGLPDLDATSSVRDQKGEEHWAKARSHTAWGVFNWVMMMSFMFQEADLSAKYPPSFDPPGKDTHLSSENSTVNTPADLPGYMGRTFPAMCEFWLLTRDWMTIYYVSDDVPVHHRVSFDFAYGTFQKLLIWSSKLNTMLARGDHSSHYSIIFHIWFHASIIQLFRPFAQHTVKPFIHNDFAVAAFTASQNQFKHLAVIFRYKFACAPYAAFWHIALLHIANAVVQDTEDPQWRAYFLLCLDSYVKLYSSFRIAGGILKSLLSIALRRRAITVSEAQELMAQVSERGFHHTDVDDISTSFVVDLDLVYADREAAQLTTLNKMFDDLALIFIRRRFGFNPTSTFQVVWGTKPSVNREEVVRAFRSKSL